MARSSDQLRRLNKRFAAVSQAVRDAVRPALEKSADQLVAAARHLVPEDQGDLKDSIRKEAGEHELQVAVKAGDGDAFYARWVEFGTSEQEALVAFASEQEAQPFFFPAYRLNKKPIEARIKRAVTKAIKDEWVKR